VLDAKVIGNHMMPLRLIFYSDDFVRQVGAFASFPRYRCD